MSDKIEKGHFQQTNFWCDFKARHGWLRVQLGDMNVLVRCFMHGIFSMAYVPMAPALDPKVTDSAVILVKTLSNLGRELKPLLPKRTICVRFDPAVDFFTPGERDDFVRAIKLVSFVDKAHLKKSRTDIQPPDTTIIDLRKSEDDLLAAMKSKWRYNINLSKRKGVVIERVTAKSENYLSALDTFYNLYEITGKRDGIALHDKSYYRTLLEMSAGIVDAPKVTLYLARHENDYLAGIITLITKSESVYLYGASSDTKRNLMPNFLLQWTAICDAKKEGSLNYDLYGMPPTGDENHPMHGLYQFKTGFMGQNTHRIGSWDVVLSPLYNFVILAESLRAFYHKKFLKKIRAR